MGEHHPASGKVKPRGEITGTTWKTAQLPFAAGRLPAWLCSDSPASPAHGSPRTRSAAAVLGVKMVPEKHLVGPEPTRRGLGTLRMLGFLKRAVALTPPCPVGSWLEFAQSPGQSRAFSSVQGPPGWGLQSLTTDQGLWEAEGSGRGYRPASGSTGVGAGPASLRPRPPSLPSLPCHTQ